MLFVAFSCLSSWLGGGHHFNVFIHTFEPPSTTSTRPGGDDMEEDEIDKQLKDVIAMGESSRLDEYQRWLTDNFNSYLTAPRSNRRSAAVQQRNADDDDTDQDGEGDTTDADSDGDGDGEIASDEKEEDSGGLDLARKEKCKKKEGRDGTVAITKKKQKRNKNHTMIQKKQTTKKNKRKFMESMGMDETVEVQTKKKLSKVATSSLPSPSPSPSPSPANVSAAEGNSASLLLQKDYRILASIFRHDRLGECAASVVSTSATTIVPSGITRHDSISSSSSSSSCLRHRLRHHL